MIDYQYQRTLVWDGNLGIWKLRWEAVLPMADVEPTEQQPADPWTLTWLNATPPPYVIWERWLPEYYKVDAKNWWLVQTRRNWK